MCGIAAIFGQNINIEQLRAMVAVQSHRGPDAEGLFINTPRTAALGHNRLSIIDLSDSGHQPMSDADNKVHLVFNGEIYNYLELKRELASEYEFRTRTDTEVLLAAYLKWGTQCLEKFIGMFAFVIYDERDQTIFAARDRFGVKPLYYHWSEDGKLFISSEIKALHSAGVKAEFNDQTWATYLACGLQEHSAQTFWKDIQSLPPAHFLQGKLGEIRTSRWYDLAETSGNEFDQRSETEVAAEYLELLKESVNLRFRADVPIGINLSGGVDSSTLLGLVHAVEGAESSVKVFTFITDDERYDELPWVRKMLARTQHPLVICRLKAQEIPALAAEMQYFQDEPFGGIPTLAYAKLFAEARKNGVAVLLDGNGMDEQWAGYDYYSANGKQPQIIQGTMEKPVKPECLIPEFRELAKPLAMPTLFPDALRNLQYRDTCLTKIPRVLRFNDRASMRSSTELREPFLDHRLFELALRQPLERKIKNGIGKQMLRRLTQKLLPQSLAEAPKRPVQTPQREWLRGELQPWANERIEDACEKFGGSWLDKKKVRQTWKKFCDGESDNSFYVWQWISLSLIAENNGRKFEPRGIKF